MADLPLVVNSHVETVRVVVLRRDAAGLEDARLLWEIFLAEGLKAEE